MGRKNKFYCGFSVRTYVFAILKCMHNFSLPQIKDKIFKKVRLCEKTLLCLLIFDKASTVDSIKRITYVFFSSRESGTRQGGGG